MYRSFVLTLAAALAGSLTFSAVPPLALARQITIHQHGVPFVPERLLPASHAASKSDRIVELFQTIGRTTVWTLVEKVPFEGPFGEPEGIARIGEDRYFVSEGEYTAPTVSYNGSIIDGTDRTPGAGTAHIKVFDGKGKLIADATVSDVGSNEYHTGGIDYSDGFLWATIAQYRPNSTCHMIRIDPRTLEYKTLFRANDHYGGSVYDPSAKKLYTLNWGSRNSSTWDLGDKHLIPNRVTAPRKVVRNPSYFVDYQDCNFLGHPAAYGERAVALCGGVTGFANNVKLGGVAIVDLETMVPLAEVPIMMLSDLGGIVSNNPVDVDVVGGRLRLYFLPDSTNATLYVYEAQPQSPYEY